jgi:hypothetical protein
MNTVLDRKFNHAGKKNLDIPACTKLSQNCSHLTSASRDDSNRVCIVSAASNQKKTSIASLPDRSCSETFFVLDWPRSVATLLWSASPRSRRIWRAWEAGHRSSGS